MSGALVVRASTATPDRGTVTSITPESAGWAWCGLDVVEVAAGASRRWDLDVDEAVVLPLRGGCAVQVEDGGTTLTAVLGGRPSVFHGPSDFLYAGRGSSVTVTAPATSAVRVAVARSRAERHLPSRVVPATDVTVELRGAGRASRQVTGYTLGTDVAVDHLLVCEVVTPGGNWSSYPPHKHDEHTDVERALEEIYYFEVADGPPQAGPGFAYHRVYGTPERPIDVLAEVRSGDVVLVPHGYHGPTIAAPGYDLYYLNVMAGPARDGRWLSVDDPAHHWVRDTWEPRDVDPSDRQNPEDHA